MNEEYIENRFLDICGDYNDTNPDHDWEKNLKETIRNIIKDTKEACNKSLEYNHNYRDPETVKRIGKAEVKE